MRGCGILHSVREYTHNESLVTRIIHVMAVPVFLAESRLLYLPILWCKMVFIIEGLITCCVCKDKSLRLGLSTVEPC